MRAFQLFEEGMAFGFAPHEATYMMLVERPCQFSDVGKAKKVVHYMLQQEGVDKVRIYNIIFRCSVLIDNPTELLDVLVEMLQNNSQPDVISLNTLLHGLCKAGRTSEALSVFHDMLSVSSRFQMW